METKGREQGNDYNLQLILDFTIWIISHFIGNNVPEPSWLGSQTGV